jgi:hypothetical protein
LVGLTAWRLEQNDLALYFQEVQSSFGHRSLGKNTAMLTGVAVILRKRTHTAVSADELGRKLSTKTVGSTSSEHLALLKWARAPPDPERLWALEDYRNMTRRLESDLIAAGERVVRVPPKLDGSRPEFGAHLRQVGPDRRLGHCPRSTA